jgi:hypothetical protein
MKLLNSEDVHYYRSALVGLLQACVPGEEHHTHHFHYLDIYVFRGSYTRPFLRKCLRTLESLGYLMNHPKGFNTHKWSITDKGISYLATYDKLNHQPLN